MEKIFKQIMIERKRQDEKWGGPDHDDNHSVRGWVYFIISHATKAFNSNVRVNDFFSGMVTGIFSSARCQPSGYRKTRRQLVRVAALAGAAIESIDRKNQKKKTKT